MTEETRGITVRLVAVVCVAAMLAATSCTARQVTPQWLRVSANGHYLVTPDGTPFVIQADSAWWLAERSSRSDVTRYLDARRDQGFNTVMFAATLDFGKGRNVDGQSIWSGDAAAPNPRFFEHVDYIVDQAAVRGMHVAMAPAWVKHVTPPNGEGLSVQNAYTFGQWIGERYRDDPIIWLMGGDDVNWHEAIVDELARGVTHGVTGSDTGHDGVVMTYHPAWAQSSAARFHRAAWLDFNFIQSGHCGRTLTAGHQLTAADFDRWPTKPTMDGESFYEGHPRCMDSSQPYSTPRQVRNGLYNAAFGGGAGLAYGHHSVWQMYQPGRKGVNGPVRYWYDAINDPAATHVVHLRRLLESRPILTRIPDGGSGTASTGTRSTRAEDGSYAMTYSSDGTTITMDLNRLSGSVARLWWFDPRQGTAAEIGDVAAEGVTVAAPPDAQDWVLVADDANREFPPPGTPFVQPRDGG